MARPARRRDLRHEDAQHDRQPRQLTVAGGAQRAALAARVRRSGALQARGRRRREARARGAEPAADDDERDARVPRLDGAERDRELRLRAPGVRRLSDAGRLRRGRRPRRQPAAGGVADRRRHADAAVLRHLRRQLVRHARAAGGSPQPAADVHRRRGPRLHGGRRSGIGRADEVAVMIFTEFGRRVEENGSLGTDHGTATPMFIVGKGVRGGFYGKHPSLTDLDDGNMKMTTDFRRVYATMIKEWLGYDDTAAVLKGRLRAARRVRVTSREKNR